MKTSFLKSLLILKKIKWINDGQYAYAIINANQLSGDKGPYVLIQKLTQKGGFKIYYRRELERI